MTESVERYYISAPEVPVPERLRVLKHDETCGLFNDSGDIDAHARHEEGLYHRGTRYLSKLTLKLMGARPLLLSSAFHRDNLVDRFLSVSQPVIDDLFESGRVRLGSPNRRLRTRPRLSSRTDRQEHRKKHNTCHSEHRNSFDHGRPCGFRRARAQPVSLILNNF